MPTLTTDTRATALEHEASTRERMLQDWLRARGSVLVGFSGGVDSAYLATVAVETLGPDRVLAVIGRSASYPASQWATARAVADQFAVPVLEVDTDEMNDPRYAANPVNRCYFCKSELWDRLGPIARERDLAVVADGTNADDSTDYRPGAAAARERDVASPLAEAGLTKAHIRLLSQRRGIPTWSQPSSPCLSSRLPYGTAVTPARLAQVEQAEAALRALGVTGDLRVRFHGELARVELAIEVLQQWLEPGRSAQVADAVRSAGFARVAIDLRGFRSGSLNVLGGVTSQSAPAADGAGAHHQSDHRASSPAPDAPDAPDAADAPEAPEAPDRSPPTAAAGATAAGADAETAVAGTADAGTAVALQASLAAHGLPGRVEVRGSLGILVGVQATAPMSSVVRRQIVRAALAAGFSHVALDIDAALDSASQTTGQPASVRHAALPGVPSA